MSSSGVNVLRYSALVAGVLYGLYHQASITAQTKINQINREYQHQSHLIQKAKEEYTRKTMPKNPATEGGVVSDPDDPRFDLEAYLSKVDLAK